MQRLLKVCISVSLTLIILLMVVTHYRQGYVKGDWEFDADPPRITVVINCTVVGDENNLCTGNEAELRIDYIETAAEAGLRTAGYVVNGSVINPTTYLTPIVTKTITQTVPIVAPTYIYNVDASAGDHAGNGSTARGSLVFVKPWYKLKNASFHRVGALQITLAPTVARFDSDDTTDRYLVIHDDNNDKGVVSADNSINTDPVSDSPMWNSASYNRQSSMTPAAFIEYLKSRKEYVSLPNTGVLLDDLDGIQSNKINFFNGNININSGVLEAKLTSKNTFLLVVQGDMTINVNNKFNKPKRDIALIVTGTLKINSQVEEMYGIFIANGIDFAENIGSGSTTDKTLKIEGNIVSYTDTSSSVAKRDRTDTRKKPSIFVVFNPEYYTKLVGLLSVATYDWKQLR